MCEECGCIKGIFYCLSFTVQYGLIISNFVAIFLYFKYDFKNNLIISELQNSINGHLIESISLKKNCNFDEEKLILGIWDGTQEGCDCDGVIFEKKCSDDKTKNGCKTLFENAPVDYTIFNSTYLCAKRNALSYKELLGTENVVPKGTNCPYNYKPCGMLDTLERQYCVKNGESCPINNITIQNLFSNLLNNMVENNEILNDLSDEDNSKSQLISVIKVGQYQPCINPAEKYWDYHYVLESSEQRCQTTLLGSLYDARYKQIPHLTISEYQLYTDNSIMGKLKDIDEVNLNKIKAEEIFLYTRHFLGFDYKELMISEFNYDNLLHYQEKTNKCFLAQMIITIIIVGSLVLSLALNCFKTVGSEKCELNKECLTNFLLCIFIFLSIVSSIIYLIIYSIIIDSVKEIKSNLNIKGGDAYTKELIKIVIEEGSFNYTYSLVMVILSSIGIVLLPFIFMGFCACLDDNNEF